MTERQLDNYVLASLPETFNVMGLRLVPFCLGHFFWMKKFCCPFASDDPDEMGNCEDLFFATLICSRTWEGFNDFLNDKEVKYVNIFSIPSVIWEWVLDTLTRTTQSERWLKKWDKALTKAFSIHRFHKTIRFLNRLKYSPATLINFLLRFKKKAILEAIDEFVKFNEYRRTDLFVPYFWNESSSSGHSGRSSGSHWSMNIYQFLMKELHYTSSEALNMPLSRALVEYYKGLESIGSISLMNDQECAIEEGKIQTISTKEAH